MKYFLIFTLTVFCVFAVHSRKHHRHFRKRLTTEVNGNVSPSSYQMTASNNAPLNQEHQTQYPSTYNRQPYYMPYRSTKFVPVLNQERASSTQNTDDAADESSEPSERQVNHTIPLLKERLKEIDNGKIKHHNYEELTWLMKYCAEQCPNILRMYSIGKGLISFLCLLTRFFSLLESSL